MMTIDDLPVAVVLAGERFARASTALIFSTSDTFLACLIERDLARKEFDELANALSVVNGRVVFTPPAAKPKRRTKKAVPA